MAAPTALGRTEYLARLEQLAQPAPPAEALEVDSLIDRLGVGPELATFASRIADPDWIAADQVDLLNGWLRHAISDSSQARRQWSALAEFHRVDRDQHVADLWQRLLDDGTQPRNLKKHVEARWCPWSFYQEAIFNWFLSRFDLPAARSVFAGRRRSGVLHWSVVAASLVCAAAAHPWLDLNRSALIVLALSAAVAALALASQRLFDLPVRTYAQSLIPRLGAAVGIGYLFLFNAPQIVRLVCESPRPAWHLLLATLVLVAAALLYTVLHVVKRVHPRPRPRDLWRRAGDLLSLATAYAAVELTLLAPLLFSRSLLFGLSGAPPPVKFPVHWQHFALCAAIAMNLGVVLQVAWDEKPLTEPL